MNQIYLLIGALVLAASDFVSPHVALALGLFYGIALQPSGTGGQSPTKYLLQGSVVARGFGMNLQEVIHAGHSGFVYTAFGITASMIIGLAFGRLLTVGPTASLLISAGTVFCGGSAIAAVGPIAEASEEEMAVSLATIFVLNSVALLTFPPIGFALGLALIRSGWIRI
jgi:uncharacterized membrane protein YadS